MRQNAKKGRGESHREKTNPSKNYSSLGVQLRKGPKMTKERKLGKRELGERGKNRPNVKKSRVHGH